MFYPRPLIVKRHVIDKFRQLFVLFGSDSASLEVTMVEELLEGLLRDWAQGGLPLITMNESIILAGWPLIAIGIGLTITLGLVSALVGRIWPKLDFDSLMLNRPEVGWVFMILFLAPLGVCLLLSFALPTVLRDKNFEPFESHYNDYVAAFSYEKSPGGAYIKGKILVLHYGPYAIYQKEIITIDEDSTQAETYFDDINFSLPDELRARSPEEVDTLVWIEWGRDTLASYEGGSVAAQIYGRVTIIDLVNKAVVSDETFYGSRPNTPKIRSCVSGCDNLYGSAPTEEIVSYITSLPRK